MKGQPIPDGQRCINCHTPAVKGVIKHVPGGCPEWTKGSPR